MVLKNIVDILSENGIYVNEDDYDEDLGLDSLSYISMIVDIEKIFRISVPDEYLALQPKTVNEFVTLVTEIIK